MVSARFRSPAWFGSLLIPLLVATGVRAADSLETVQRAAAEWAKLRAETVRLETDWQSQRGTLEASLVALKARITMLEQKRDELQAGIEGEAAKSADVTVRNETARQAVQTVDQHLQTLAGQLVALRPWLPPRVSQGLELAYRSIQDVKLGPAERMQHVVTIFNRCGSFNKSITFGEEPLALDGSANPRLLEVIYWGLSHGYALDRTGGTAYFGHPGKDGWTWERSPESTTAVTALIEIYHERSDPAFVQVPVQVTETQLNASPAGGR